jgi:hypothetical protein
MSLFSCLCFKRQALGEPILQSEDISKSCETVILKPQDYSREKPLRLSELRKDVRYRIAPGLMFFKI